jgi:hypothetical protein
MNAEYLGSAQVAQDVLLMCGEHDGFQPPSLTCAQAKALTAARSVAVRMFTKAEHADQHCQIGNIGLACRLLTTWLRNTSPEPTGPEYVASPSLHRRHLLKNPHRVGDAVLQSQLLGDGPCATAVASRPTQDHQSVRQLVNAQSTHGQRCGTRAQILHSLRPETLITQHGTDQSGTSRQQASSRRACSPMVNHTDSLGEQPGVWDRFDDMQTVGVASG